jgi:Cd2+/Zn2+-exporting ATPase
MGPFVLKIHGLDCAAEAAVLTREISPLAGGEDRLAFDFVNGRMVVTPGPDGPGAEEVIEAVRTRTGMRAELWKPRRGALKEPRRLSRRTLLTVLSGILTALAFAAHALEAGALLPALEPGRPGEPGAVPLLAVILYALAIASGGWLVAPRALRALRRLRPDMNLLMTIAVLGAAAIGQWFEAATVTFLFAISLELESWSMGRARRAVEALLDLAPAIARLRRPDGSEAIVSPEEVRVADTFVVKPGERFPLDGVVRLGMSEVDQAPITGESVPVPKEPGDTVFAGTINGGGALEIECTREADETTLHHIIRMVEEAATRRAPSERWVDRFARYYTPVILGLALVVLVVPPLALGGAWSDWIYRSLVFLVIGCPCALVISTPVSIAAALAASAHHGVLVKGGDALESAARLKAVAFDKTGTLTEGRPRVLEVVPFDGHDERELLERATAMEARSAHPFAQAVVAFSRERGIPVVPAQEFQVVPGRGATGVFDGKPYWLGSHRYLEERGQETPDVHDTLERLGAAGHTVAVIGNDRHVCGFITAADGVRAEARSVVASLRHEGIEHVVMLTGDNPGTADAIARQIGVDVVLADLLPADKVLAVERLVKEYGSVAMVGDGVNDAPAMARATLSIAMGAAGSDAAIEAADVALMADDLEKIPWLIRHARSTVSVIAWNISLSLSIKILFVVLTLMGLSSLWGAIAADMGASFLVIANGLRLLKPGR